MACTTKKTNHKKWKPKSNWRLKTQTCKAKNDIWWKMIQT
jgi:hypothetical protein